MEAMIGMNSKVKMWFTRYWYPSFTYLNFMDLEESGNVCGILTDTIYYKTTTSQKEEENTT